MTLEQYYNKATLTPVLQQLHQEANKILKLQPDISFTEFCIQTEQNSPLFMAELKKDHAAKAKESFTAALPALLKELDISPLETQELVFKQIPQISIIGAGSAGLLAAIVLNKLGYQVEIFEARGQHDSMLRPQNISFKEAEERLKPMLGEALYNQFFERAASMDGDTGKLRISIGAFQEVLSEELARRQVLIHYNKKLSLEDIKHLSADIILLTTGVHTADYFNIQTELNPQIFPEFTVFGRTALYIRATDEPHGYRRSEREGYHWRRDNITVYDGKTVGYDLRRMIRNLEKYGDPHNVIPRLHELQNAPSVEYSFIFGNDTDRFLEGLDTNPQYLIQQTRYEVKPMLSLNTILHFSNIPTMILGDANGSPHPLAAIGTLKFIRNIQDYLPEFVFNHILLSRLLKSEITEVQKLATEKLLQANEELYSLSAMKNIFYVFYNNILCGIYSQPRESKA